MKNLKRRSSTRPGAILVLATGVLTGVLLALAPSHHLAVPQSELDPTIPALVIVGKRLTHQAISQSTATQATADTVDTKEQEVSTGHDAIAPLAATVGL